MHRSMKKIPMKRLSHLLINLSPGYKPNSLGEMENLVNLQMHRHAKTCKRSGNNIPVCRFNFPLPPMPRTIKLKPLEESSHNEKESKLIKENSDKIKQVLDAMKYGEDTTFEDFLKKLGLTEECYLLAIRNTLKRDKLFL